MTKPLSSISDICFYGTHTRHQILSTKYNKGILVRVHRAAESGSCPVLSSEHFNPIEKLKNNTINSCIPDLGPLLAFVSNDILLHNLDMSIFWRWWDYRIHVKQGRCWAMIFKTGKFVWQRQFLGLSKRNTSSKSREHWSTSSSS